MTITQTVEIPADRRLYLDLEIPREIPEGKARLEMKVIPFIKDEDKPVSEGKIHLTKKELDEMLKNAHTPHSDALLGLLSNFGDITIEQIREERLAKKYPEYFK